MIYHEHHDRFFISVNWGPKTGTVFLVADSRGVCGAPGGPTMPLTGLLSVRRVFSTTTGPGPTGRSASPQFGAMRLGDILSIGS